MINSFIGETKPRAKKKKRVPDDVAGRPKRFQSPWKLEAICVTDCWQNFLSFQSSELLEVLISFPVLNLYSGACAMTQEGVYKKLTALCGIWQYQHLEVMHNNHSVNCNIEAAAHSQRYEYFIVTMIIWMNKQCINYIREQNSCTVVDRNHAFIGKSVARERTNYTGVSI